MTATVGGIHLSGTHAARPGAAGPPAGSLYSCTTDSLIYRTDGTTWSTWATLGSVGGSVATDAIWDAAGDLVQGTGANTAARLAVGASGTYVRSSGATNAYAFPPGHEFTYAEITSPVSVTSTTESAGDTIVTAGAVTFDGSTVALIEFSCPYANAQATEGQVLFITLYDGSSDVGRLGLIKSATATADYRPLRLARRITPSAASHTYSIRGHLGGAGTGSVGAGAAGSGAYFPAFIRITKAT